MELSLKQSPSMNGNQDPMQAQLALQQKQLEQQQALEKADLTKVQGQIENKVGNKLDQHSPEDQQILKKALAKEAVKVGGENARIGGIGVHPQTGQIVAQVGEFHHANIDPKATLEAAKLATPEASKTLEPERERSPALDKTPERDTSQVLAKIDAKVEHKLDAYSPEEQQVLKQALAAEMVKMGGENAPISRIGVADDGRISAANERHVAVIEPRATLETAQKEQANLVREQAAQELAQQNPEQAALEKHVDERYDHYMATIQDEMKSLNAIRADYDNFAALPEAERDALNDRMNELSSQRSALHDVTDLPLQEQAAYYAQRDQGESTPAIAEAAPDIQQEQHSVPETQPLPSETALSQEQSNTRPVPEGTISEENLQRYADQGIEPVLESPPLNVPPLAPEDMTVSDAEMARLGAELNTISTEGAAVNAANTEAQAASETKEFTEINQAIEQMQDSSDKSLWENVKDAANQTLETASNIGNFIKDEGLNVLGDTTIATTEAAMAVGSGAIMQSVGGLAGLASAPFVGMDQAATITRGVADFGTYKPQSDAMKTVAMSTAPITNAIASEYQQIYDSNVDYYGEGKTALMFGGVEALGTILGGAQALRAARTAALEGTIATTTAEGISKSTTQLLEKSTASPDDLSRYLSKIDENAAKAYHETGKWPEDIQIPRSSDVLTPDGSINWSLAPEGGYVLGDNGKAIKEIFIPEVGGTIDRYGPPNGRYTSPVNDGVPYHYDQRSLPYVEDPNVYHQYKIEGDFNKIEDYVNKLPDGEVKSKIIRDVEAYFDGNYKNVVAQKGIASEAFGKGNGGAIQYELPMSVETLEKLGLLKEIK
jgi:6-pyruvoyl-tetrahydropterin synthase